MIKISAIGRSHIGLKRKSNQDRILVGADLGLFVLADGMGGHRAGGLASSLVIETMETYWRQFREGHAPALGKDRSMPSSQVAGHLLNAIALTNRVIYEAQQSAEYQGMGSTITAVAVENEGLWVANVGDSRVYFWDQGRLVRVSQDHSLVEEQRSLGLMNAFHPDSPFAKGTLTRALGMDEGVDPYLHPLSPETGDRVLMCSDGLTGYVPESTIRDVLGTPELGLGKKADRLISEALEGGGGDNISVILLEIQNEGALDRLKKRLHFGR
jgi:protein phosphatase